MRPNLEAVMIEDGFEVLVSQMHRISVGEERYGEGNEYEQATRFYLENLVDECAERAREYALGLPGHVDLLISMAGQSPRITVLAYRILRPRRLVVIPSAGAMQSIDVIHEHVVANGKLRASDFRYRVCESTDPVSIYNIVKDELTTHGREAGITSSATFIDITGGRKVMAASAALAAWQLDLRLCYVDGRYDGRLKQAVPGSDRILVLDNPISLFGEQAMGVAEQAFASGAFEAARNRFDELADRLAQPAKARFMGALSALYRAWCDLDLGALPDAIERVRRTIEPVRRTLPPGTVRSVYAQLDYLDDLGAGDEDALLVCFGVLSDHYRKIGRHDFAALYSYRLIEACSRARLAYLSPGFADQRFDFAQVTTDRAALQERYRVFVEEVRGPGARVSLPRESGVFSNVALLHVLDDTLPAGAGLGDAQGVRELQTLAEARNRSVLAHGKAPVDVTVSQALHEQALRLLRSYWALRYPDDDIDVRRAVLAFVLSDHTP